MGVFSDIRTHPASSTNCTGCAILPNSNDGLGIDSDRIFPQRVLHYVLIAFGIGTGDADTAVALGISVMAGWFAGLEIPAIGWLIGWVLRRITPNWYRKIKLDNLDF